MNLKLKELRKAAGYPTAKAYAEHLGIIYQTYHNYESGSHKLSLDLACDICDDLGCTLDELCGREVKDKSGFISRVYSAINDEGKQAMEQFAEMCWMNPSFLPERAQGGLLRKSETA